MNKAIVILSLLALVMGCEEKTLRPAFVETNKPFTITPITKPVLNQSTQEVKAQSNTTKGSVASPKPPVFNGGKTGEESTLPRAIGTAKAFKPTSYAYLLQGADMDMIIGHPRDLYILDIDDARISGVDISEIQKFGHKAVSYLSIGEAENYRDYWRTDFREGNPSWLDSENPDWPGNYKVKYWDPEWQEIVFDKLDSILDEGYDGVYLDIIDGYEHYEEQGKSDAADLMADFVKKISRNAKAKNPDFLIIPQNAPDIAYKFVEAIDGYGKEDTFYHVDNSEVPASEYGPVVEEIDDLVRAGKFILAIDYPTDIDAQCSFIAKTKKHGWVPTVGPRELDSIEDMPTCP